MLRVYHWKMVTSYCFSTKISVSLYQVLVQPRKTRPCLTEILLLLRIDSNCLSIKVYNKRGGNSTATYYQVNMLRVYHWKMFGLMMFEYERSSSLYQKGWPFSCHLITDRNIKDLSLENV